MCSLSRSCCNPTNHIVCPPPSSPEQDMLSGCYPFGIGIISALYILGATNCIGLLCTFLIPETMNKTLESLNHEEEGNDAAPVLQKKKKKKEQVIATATEATV